MPRELAPGDYAYLSIGGKKHKYIVREIALPLIYIYPELDPSQSNALTYVDNKWRVKGDEQTDYHITYEKAPTLAVATVSPVIHTKNNRLDLFRTPRGRIQYEMMIRSELDKIVAPNGYQCIDAKVNGHSLLDHFHLSEKIGEGSFGTVYSACTPLKQQGQCVEDPYVFAVKVAINPKGSVKVMPANRSKSSAWIESYLLEHLRPLIIDQGRGQAFPILYKNYPCVDGCRQSDPTKRGLVSCIINLMELAEGDLNSWAKTMASNQEDYDNALFQVMAGLAALQDVNIQVFHNDIKKENILWYRVQPGGVWKYTIGGKTYYLPNRGYVMIIGDYGVSQSYSPHVALKTKKLLKGSPIISRGGKGIVRDGEAGISYPLLFDLIPGIDYRFFNSISSSRYIVDLNEMPIEISANLSKITPDDRLVYRVPTQRLYVSAIEYNGNMDRIPAGSCPRYNTLTTRERDILGNINICSNEILNRTDIYPNVEYITDTQDGIRLFAGGERISQDGPHLPIEGAPQNWLTGLSDYISGKPNEKTKSFFNRKMFAQDFLSHYFNGKYTGPGNEMMLAEFTCTL